MITCNNFYKAYWSHYISLEKEFRQTCSYVEIDAENDNTFSSAYLKLLLSIGSEIDITLKFYCKLLDSSFNGSNINNYIQWITQREPAFFSQNILLGQYSINLQPWNNKDNDGNNINPEWWKAYNKCKHDRTGTGNIGSDNKEYLRFANQKYVLNSLAGLYQTLIYSFKILADNEGDVIKTPIPGSRLFELNGALWDTIHFYHDVAFYLDRDKNFIQHTGCITY